MSATKIRADYEGLQKITQSFLSEAGLVSATAKSIKTVVDTLRGGDWVGPGASAFFQEMDAAVFPGLNRLSAALGDAAQAATRINGLMNGAERDAAAVLRGVGEDGARHKDGETVVGASSLIDGLMRGVAGGLVGMIAGADAGNVASEKVGEWMDAMAARAAADQARREPVQTYINAKYHQFAVDEAIKQYGIDVSAVNGKVAYNADTDGEGLTLKDGTVTIGDDAFTTPGWLASSIGHEALHAEQIRDGRFNDTSQGVAMNEVEAYDWEIRNADRFGLSEAEKATINRRRDTKYGRLSDDNKARADQGNYTVP